MGSVLKDTLANKHMCKDLQRPRYLRVLRRVTEHSEDQIAIIDVAVGDRLAD